MTGNITDEIKKLCDKHVLKGPPPDPHTCPECDDHALLYYPHHQHKRTYWYAFRCHCLQAKDWGPVKVGEKEVRGKIIPIIDHKPRRYSSEIPIWADFRRKDGQPLTQDDVYSLSQRHTFEQFLREI